MMMKKTKATVPTVEHTEPTSVTQDTVDVVMGNSPTTNGKPLKATVAPKLPPDVIRVPLKLEDVQYQVGMFKDFPRGRYVMSYEDGSTVQVLSVYWDGVDTVSV
jgi:hypothetical protein